MTQPSFIQIYPTLKCNQNCIFCFNRNITNPAFYRDMDKNDAFSLINAATESGIAEIDVLGGEPTLVPWIPDFSRSAIEAGITVNISTNGGLPGTVDRLMEIQDESLNVGFSILGFSETHNVLTKSDNFFRVIAEIKETVSAGCNPIVKSVLVRKNEDEIPDLVSYLAGLGVRRYYLLHEDIIGREDSAAGFSFPEFFAFYSKLKKDKGTELAVDFVAASGFYKYGIGRKGRCNAGITKIAIMPDGSAFPCNLFAGFGEFRLGNVFQEGFERIWNSPALHYFRNYGDANRCALINCRHHITCGGGCAAHSYYFYGTLDAADPRCTPPSVPLI